MGAILGSTIIARAQKTLIDETGETWSAAELLDYFAAGINAIVTYKPDAYVLHGLQPLALGALQSLPVGGLALVDVIRNAAGRAIVQKDRNDLDHSNPTWRSLPPTADILHFMFDKRDPKYFHVYPPATAGAQVEMSWCAVPTRYSNPANPIPIDDIYENPLHAWTVGYAYAKNAKRGDLQKASGYWGIFANSIALKSQVQVQFEPLVPEETPGSQRSR